MKTIYLHIGTPKTGTTSLQKILASNRRLLLEKGYFYPPQGIPSHDNGHHCLAWSFLHPDGVRTDAYLGKRFECGQVPADVLDAIQNQAVENVILTSEYFWLLENISQIEAVKDMLKGYRVILIVYLRRQDRFFLSSYSENVKRGCVKPFLTFQRERQIKGDYRLLLSQWRKVFGHSNVIARRYQENSDKAWLINDFLQTLEIPLEGNQLKYASRPFNVSLSVKSLKLIQFLNYLLIEKLRFPFPFCKRLYLLPLQRPKVIKLVRWVPDWLLSNELISAEEQQALLAQYSNFEQLFEDACDEPNIASPQVVISSQ